jgi:hypothetical protein
MQLIKFALIPIVATLSAGLVTAVHAAAVPAAQTESALKQADQKLAAKERVARRLCGNTGSPNKTRQQSIHCTGATRAKRKQLRVQRQEVQTLLDELEAGRPVDPTAVDRVLREAGVSMP